MKKFTRALPAAMAVLLIAARATAFEAPQPTKDSSLYGIEPTVFEYEEAVEGELSEDDALSENSYVDAWAFEAPAGVSVAVYLTSADFDTYLFALDANGEEYSNDDSFEYALPSGLDSAITLPAYDEATAVTVYASSYSERETGSYTLSAVAADTMNVSDSAPLDAPALGEGDWRELEELGLPTAEETLSMGETISGSLSTDDSESLGYYLDGYSVDVSSGDFVRVDVIGGMTDEGFNLDTRLVVLTPGGEFLSNDDAPIDANLPNRLDSSVTFTASESGEAEIFVTSYSSGAIGPYELLVTDEEYTVPTYDGLFTDPIEPGETVEDSFSAYRDYEAAYTLEVESGDTLNISLASDSVDTYLEVYTPDGLLENDDDWEAEEFTTNSRVIYTATQSGEVTIVASPLSGMDEGDFTLTVADGAAQ